MVTSVRADTDIRHKSQVNTHVIVFSYLKLDPSQIEELNTDTDTWKIPEHARKFALPPIESFVRNQPVFRE